MIYICSVRLCVTVLIAITSQLSYANGSVPLENSASEWILERFKGAPVISGDLEGKKTVDTPALVYNAIHTRAGKNSFQPRNISNLSNNQIGFLNVSISGLFRDNSPLGAGIATDRNNDNVGTILYLSNVTITPGWPDFISYDESNFDGIVLDGSAAVYGQDITIYDVNNDSAIDNKAQISQFVRLDVSGKAHRSIRYWRTGPHYLVNSRIENPGGAGSGSLIWMKDCAATELRVYNSVFNGSRTIPLDKIQCENSSGPPKIKYLSKDPRGSMHPMFGASTVAYEPIYLMLLGE